MGKLEHLRIPLRSRTELAHHRPGVVRRLPDDVAIARDERLLMRILQLTSHDRSPRGMDLEIVSDGALPEGWIEYEIKVVVNARGIGQAMGFISQHLDHGEDPDRYLARVLLMPVEDDYLPHVPERERIALIANGKRLRSFPLLLLRH